MFENPNQVYYSSGRTTGPKGQQDTKLFCVVRLIPLLQLITKDRVLTQPVI